MEEKPSVNVVIAHEKMSVSEAARILKTKGTFKRARKQAAAVMSEAGASKGGQARARNLSPERIKEIARLGGLARQRKARESKAQRDLKAQ